MLYQNNQPQDRTRQVALLLISLTIITVGVIYNQASAPKTQAQLFGTYSQTSTNTGANTTPQNNTTTPNTATQPSTDNTQTQPTIVVPKTNTNTDTNTISDNPSDLIQDLPETTLEDIWASLQLLNQLTRTSNAFAYSIPEIKLPGIKSATPSSSFSETLPTVSLPDFASEIPQTAPSAPDAQQPEDNEVITILKDLSGYSKWEEFKTNFITAKEQYSGTGRCMIDIQGLGCLVQW